MQPDLVASWAILANRPNAGVTTQDFLDSHFPINDGWTHVAFDEVVGRLKRWEMPD